MRRTGTRSPADVPWIDGVGTGTIGGTRAHEPRGKLIHIRFAHKNGAGIKKLLHREGRALGCIGIGGAGCRGFEPFHVHIVLDGEGNAKKGKAAHQLRTREIPRQIPEEGGPFRHGTGVSEMYPHSFRGASADTAGEGGEPVHGIPSFRVPLTDTGDGRLGRKTGHGFSSSLCKWTPNSVAPNFRSKSHAGKKRVSLLKTRLIFHFSTTFPAQKKPNGIKSDHIYPDPRSPGDPTWEKAEAIL